MSIAPLFPFFELQKAISPNQDLPLVGRGMLNCVNFQDESGEKRSNDRLDPSVFY
jgi:hypothetical protein